MKMPHNRAFPRLRDLLYRSAAWSSLYRTQASSALRDVPKGDTVALARNARKTGLAGTR
jgi:hypothetical protein